MLLQGHGEGFSMFSTDNGRQGYAEGKGGSIWGDSQSRAANMDQYTQLLQQGPAVRSSLDSRSSGGLFGGGPPDLLNMPLVYRSTARAHPQQYVWLMQPLSSSSTRSCVQNGMLRLSEVTSR